MASYCHRQTFYGKITLGQGKAGIPARLEVYLMKTANSKIVNTPYDDVFRTLLNDCSRLIIPVINEVFHECYSGEEKVVFSPEIHFLNQQDGEEVKRITDSSFTIVGKEKKKFLYECQSTADSSMLVRIFEYATQIALDQGEIIENTLKVEIPHSAILFLRSTRSTPDKMKIEMTTPGGTVSFDIPVMKAQKYGIDEIFEKIEWMIKECRQYGTQASLMNLLERTMSRFSMNMLLENLEYMQKLDPGQFDTMSAYYLEKILEKLQKAYIQTENCDRISQIELTYRGILSWDKMKCTRRALERSPALYAEMAGIIYLKDGEEKKEGTQEQRRLVSNVYDLFQNARFCPAEKDGHVEEKELRQWVEEFVSLLNQQNQKRLFGRLLGRIFANSPGGEDGFGPCESVKRDSDMRIL